MIFGMMWESQFIYMQDFVQNESMKALNRIFVCVDYHSIGTLRVLIEGYYLLTKYIGIQNNCNLCFISSEPMTSLPPSTPFTKIFSYIKIVKYCVKEWIKWRLKKNSQFSKSRRLSEQK